jgi:hypothetical protein
VSGGEGEQRNPARYLRLLTGLYAFKGSRLTQRATGGAESKMPKRKAKELDNGVAAEAPRRSSRRISTALPGEPQPATSAKAGSTTKKSEKAPKISKDEKPVASGKKEEDAETVSFVSDLLTCS